MKIILAPDKFKGSLTARQVCEAMQAGIRRVIPDAEIILHPLADGGEGSLDILAAHLQVEEIEAIVQDPLFRPLRARYLKNESTAYIEMARASGLHLLKAEERNARHTTTYGTGQLIRNAIQWVLYTPMCLPTLPLFQDVQQRYRIYPVPRRFLPPEPRVRWLRWCALCFLRTNDRQAFRPVK